MKVEAFIANLSFLTSDVASRSLNTVCQVKHIIHHPCLLRYLKIIYR